MCIADDLRKAMEELEMAEKMVEESQLTKNLLDILGGFEEDAEKVTVTKKDIEDLNDILMTEGQATIDRMAKENPDWEKFLIAMSSLTRGRHSELKPETIRQLTMTTASMTIIYLLKKGWKAG